MIIDSGDEDTERATLCQTIMIIILRGRRVHSQAPTCLQCFLLGQAWVVGHNDVIDASFEECAGQALFLTQGGHWIIHG